MTGDGIGPGFAGLLINAVVGVGGKSAALAGFKIHHVVAQRAAVQAKRRFPRFLQQRQINAETAVGGFGTGPRLEHQIHRRAALNQLQGVGDVGQNARLGRNGEALNNIVKHMV